MFDNSDKTACALNRIANHLTAIREYLGWIAIVVVCTGLYRCHGVLVPSPATVQAVKQLFP